ncbi:unnamed protein product [Arabis nemorensis]|uniref:RING-type domain-containing protein n=1 Tax=Arabis nemorensis TaxID=586526 RepID=A0A565B997_9BRAS|nr:unnamed protein product [Arabis nemorensis]
MTTSASDRFYPKKSQSGRSHSDLRSDPCHNRASLNGDLRHRRDSDVCDSLRRVRQLCHRVGFSERKPVLRHDQSNAQCSSETQCKSSWGSYSFSESLERDRLCNRLRGMSLSSNRLRSYVSAHNVPVFHRKKPQLKPECNKNRQALDVTNGLHMQEVSSSEVNTESRECIFCLESLANGETLIQLNCNHIYHSDCLGPWLEIHGDCPYCRRLVTNPHEREEEPKPLILNRSLSWFETLLVFMGFAVTY